MTRHDVDGYEIIAGFTDDKISPLFEKAHDVENIVLPPNWYGSLIIFLRSVNNSGLYHVSHLHIIGLSYPFSQILFAKIRKIHEYLLPLYPIINKS